MKSGAKNLTLFDKIMGGGLLAGRKTYLAAAGLAVTAIIGWLIGEIDAMGLIERLIAAFGVAGLRAGITKLGVQCALPATMMALFLGLALAGCATPQAETSRQRYAAALTDYSVALTIMVGYRDVCDATPDMLFGDCVAHVEKLRQLDGLARAALTSAGNAVKAGSGDAGALVSASVSVIARIGVYMIQARMVGGDGVEAQAWPTGPPRSFAAFTGRWCGGADHAPPHAFGGRFA